MRPVHNSINQTQEKTKFPQNTLLLNIEVKKT